MTFCRMCTIINEKYNFVNKDKVMNKSIDVLRNM